MYQSPVREKNAHVVIVAAADDDDDDDDDDDKKTRYQSTHCHFLDGVILELHIFEIDLHSFPPSVGIQDSLGFWNPRCGFQIPGTGFQSLSVELGLCFPIISGIPDSLSCIPDSKPQESGFHKQNFPRLQIPQAKIIRIPEYIFP